MLGALVQNTSDAAVLVLLFGFTIFVHEFGHFIAALGLGLVVDTFSLGFGPAIWKRKVRGITYKIGILPLGGYVSLPQLDPAGMEKIQGKADAGPAGDLPRVAPWKKIVVSLSGAAGNVLLAFALAWIIYLSPSQVEEALSGTRVGFVDTNSVAYAVGLVSGAEIKAVNGEKVAMWQDMVMACYLAHGRTNMAELTVLDGGRQRRLSLPIREDGLGIEGVERSVECVVLDIIAGSPAEAAGLKPDDVIRECDGEPVSGTAHFIRLVGSRGGQAVPLRVQRGNVILDAVVTPRFDEGEGRAMIGAMVGGSFDPAVMPWMQFKEPLAQIRSDAAQILRILRALVTPREAGQAAKGLGGPVMIIATLWIAIKVSILNAVGFLRLLNVNLAIINLLPLPILDGGHIVFSVYEAVTRRRVHPKVVNMLMNVFFVLLVCVFLLLVLADSRRLPRLFRAFKAASEERDSIGAAQLTNATETAVEPAR